ncbi:MAG: cytochrome b5 domain-containing protein [Desulfurivibrionaceae bacterium]
MLKHNSLKLWIFFIFLVLFTGTACATEEYADKTGADCGVCHVDPLGGGELTEAGQGYLLSIGAGGAREAGSKNMLSRLLKLAIGYLHIITAFLWFGTILYVHLVLKPAYASTGLPKGEVKVGLVSMVIIGATGSVLTYYKIPSLDLLVSSRFGILLLAKIVIFGIMATSALFVILVIGPRLKKKKVAKPVATGDLSIAELASLDGREGHPAYFAYKGKIYDASASKLWKNGTHMQRHHAGVDLTEFLAQAPHDEEKILALPEIGRLVKKAESTGAELHKKVFFFMAYMNLSLVFIVCLILALWRW